MTGLSRQGFTQRPTADPPTVFGHPAFLVLEVKPGLELRIPLPVKFSEAEPNAVVDWVKVARALMDAGVY